MNLSAVAARYASRPHKFHIALPLAIMGVLYWSSSLPGTPLADAPALYGLFYWMPPALQNMLHIPAYAALGWAWHLALSTWMCNTPVTVMVAALVSGGYGVFDEWHQSFVPGRYASLTDVILDVAGVGLGLWLAVWARRYLASSAATVATRAGQT